MNQFNFLLSIKREFNRLSRVLSLAHIRPPKSKSPKPFIEFVRMGREDRVASLVATLSSPLHTNGPTSQEMEIERGHLCVSVK